ncbi:unnamed protein product [Pieris macdunnoughi]|uniref:Uncharacterized protein n=1 Tax=Pieris macdunnoughi TaxID=345717 RepID=A0A821X1A7_9NEOP|nr:unnamed protein product [Pieris macdunnoughi]
MRFSRLPRLDIFPEKLLPAFTNYADSVHERSHPKAEARAGRAGVIACPGPRSARSRYLLFFLVNRTSQKSTLQLICIPRQPVPYKDLTLHSKDYVDRSTLFTLSCQGQQ